MMIEAAVGDTCFITDIFYGKLIVSLLLQNCLGCMKDTCFGFF